MSYQSPQVTIIVPVFNAAKTLVRCLDSLLKQDYQNFELILVDDGSTDQSNALCRRAALEDARVKVLTGPNRGVSNARNLGIQEALGEWLCFVDADDYVSPTFLTTLLASALDEEVDIIQCGVQIVSRPNKIKQMSVPSKRLEGQALDRWRISLLDASSDILGSEQSQINGFSFAKLYRRSAVATSRFSNQLKVREDTIFNLEVTKNSRGIQQINQCAYYYVVNSQSVTGSYQEDYDVLLVHFIEAVTAIWDGEQLPKQSLVRGKLFCYMAWLKNEARAIKSIGVRRYRRRVVDSLKNPNWRKTFEMAEPRVLDPKYRMLRSMFLANQGSILALMGRIAL